MRVSSTLKGYDIQADVAAVGLNIGTNITTGNMNIATYQTAGSLMSIGSSSSTIQMNCVVLTTGNASTVNTINGSSTTVSNLISNRMDVTSGSVEQTIGSNVTIGSLTIGNQSNVSANNCKLKIGAYRYVENSYNTVNQTQKVVVGDIPLNSSFTEQIVYNYKENMPVSTVTSLFQIRLNTNASAGGGQYFTLDIGGFMLGYGGLCGKIAFYIAQYGSGVPSVSALTAIGPFFGYGLPDFSVTTGTNTVNIRFTPQSAAGIATASFKLTSSVCMGKNQYIINAL
jgi:hypothetical protein